MLSTISAIILYLAAAITATPIDHSNGQILAGIALPNISYDAPVRGNSPVRYWADPTSDIFTIDRADMDPTSCTLNLPCTIKIYGTFTRDVGTPQFDSHINVTSSSGQKGELSFSLNMCNMGEVATITQNGSTSCPPKMGSATISHALPIFSPYAVEGNYTVQANATTSSGIIYRLWMNLELLSFQKTMSSGSILPSSSKISSDIALSIPTAFS